MATRVSRLNQQQLGYAQIIVGVTLMGFTAPLIRVLGLPAPVLIALIALVATPLLLIIHRWKSPGTPIFPRADKRLLGLMCVLFVLDHMLFITGVQLTTVANMIVLAYLYPVFTTLLALPILGERIRGNVVVALLLGLTGTGLVVYRDLIAVSPDDLAGISMGFAVAFVIACKRMCVKRLDPTVSSVQVKTVLFVFSGVLFLPSLFLMDFELSASHGALLVFKVVVSGVFAGLLTLSGVRKVSASRGAILSYLEPALAVLFAWLILAETPPATAALGGALVILAGYLVARDELRGIDVRSPRGTVS